MIDPDPDDANTWPFTVTDEIVELFPKIVKSSHCGPALYVLGLVSVGTPTGPRGFQPTLFSTRAVPPFGNVSAASELPFRLFPTTIGFMCVVDSEKATPYFWLPTFTS